MYMRAQCSGGLTVLALFVACAEGTAQLSKDQASVGPGAARDAQLDEPDADATAPVLDAGRQPDVDAGHAPSGEDAGQPARQDAGTSPSQDAGMHPANDAGGGGGCSDGQMTCGGACVDTQSSSVHCGECDHTCPVAQACSGGVCAAPSGCSYARFLGHDYFFCSALKTWSDARAACLGYGLDLAIVDSQDEDDFLEPKGERWIGLNDLDSEGDYRWITPGDAASNAGTSVAYTRWSGGEPSNTQSCFLFVCSGPGEDCGEILNSGRWNDGDCGTGLPFVCESY
jgi:hypothetical protein